MIGLEDRQALARDIHITQDAGARLLLACEIVGIALRTLQRWKAVDGRVSGDVRPWAVRATPSHALSKAERTQVLADEGIYLACESSFRWMLKAHG